MFNLGVVLVVLGTGLGVHNITKTCLYEWLRFPIRWNLPLGINIDHGRCCRRVINRWGSSEWWKFSHIRTTIFHYVVPPICVPWLRVVTRRGTVP